MPVYYTDSQTGKTVKVNKWVNEFVIQEHTPYGWEDSTTETTRKLARQQMKCYRAAGVPARLIVRRVLNPLFEEIKSLKALETESTEISHAR